MSEKFEKLEPTVVPELNEILGKPFKVLGDGFVRVVDYMGSDESIVQAARVSYGKGTKKVRQDRGLIRYLMRHRHTTPMEMCEIKFHIRVPMDCWRQWIRHRTANVNEYSTRYSLAIDSAQATLPGEWRVQSTSNRQGSDGFAADINGQSFTDDETKLHNLSREVYNKRIEAGIAREQARKDLPLSTYTEAYWKIDLHNLLHFLALRMDVHAQKEIRDYSTIIGHEIVKKWVPLTWEAFEDYRLNSFNLTGLELEIVQLINQNSHEAAIKSADSNGWLEKRENGEYKMNLERIEFEEKLTKMKLQIPWGN
ncbi:MAG: FAD-dependent thymidylate synthase [Melioribacteraceae bacterium]|nr:FAD-dependent thymidylate synthase [Melioribacteraceae bacterium]